MLPLRDHLERCPSGLVDDLVEDVGPLRVCAACGAALNERDAHDCPDAPVDCIVPGCGTYPLKVAKSLHTRTHTHYPRIHTDARIRTCTRTHTQAHGHAHTHVFGDFSTQTAGGQLLSLHAEANLREHMELIANLREPMTAEVCVCVCVLLLLLLLAGMDEQARVLPCTLMLSHHTLGAGRGQGECYCPVCTPPF
jgi:hypothetical protein